MSTVTTHVLDAARGRPAAGIAVRLERSTADGPVVLASGTTDADGRLRELGPEGLPAGDYRLVFATGAWFAREGVEAFYPEVCLVFSVTDPAQHYHVPVLLSPYAFSTYRGS
jgi:5-hydroxyisourate hydrolase